MDHREKFNEITLPEINEFHSNFYSNFTEDITDADYIHAKRVCKEFEINNLGQYQDLHLRSDALLLVEVFKNSGKMCLQIYELDPVKFISAFRLAWQAA